jgi:hypothetical protein
MCKARVASGSANAELHHVEDTTFGGREKNPALWLRGLHLLGELGCAN